jgi:hypothetical protein
MADWLRVVVAPTHMAKVPVMVVGVELTVITEVAVPPDVT